MGEDLEGQVVHRHDARARPAQRQKAVGRVHERRAPAAQLPGQGDLLEEQLGAAAAPLDEPVAQPVAGLRGQRAGEVAGIDPRPMRHGDVGVAGVEGDQGHGAGA